MGDVADLASLDRDAGRAVAALASWRAALARDVESAAEEAPLEPLRHVAGRTTWLALDELSPSESERPWRDALRRWVLALTFARVGRQDEIALARSTHEPRGVYEGEPARRVSWRAAWRGVASSKNEAEVRLWLDAAGGCAAPVAAAERAHMARRAELARRLGVDHPWSAFGPASPEALRAAAHRLLDATEDLSRAIDRGPRGANAVGIRLHAAVARDAGEGWPAAVSKRWLEETFAAAEAPASLVLPPLPATLGAASFVRAMAAFGAALRTASVPRGVPRALAQEPGARTAHRLGHVVAGLACEPAWHARALGLGRRAAEAQARALARVRLFSARLDAVRLLLGDDVEPAPTDAFDALLERVLGGPPDRRLRAAWPAAREDEPSRLVACLEAPALAARIREAFDDDWFRDERAWASVRAEASLLAVDPVDAETLTRAAEAFARAHEEVLG